MLVQMRDSPFLCLHYAYEKLFRVAVHFFIEMPRPAAVLFSPPFFLCEFHLLSHVIEGRPWLA